MVSYQESQLVAILLGLLDLIRGETKDIEQSNQKQKISRYQFKSQIIRSVLKAPFRNRLTVQRNGFPSQLRTAKS
jgi:hypothetical protein